MPSVCTCTFLLKSSFSESRNVSQDLPWAAASMLVLLPGSCLQNSVHSSGWRVGTIIPKSVLFRSGDVLGSDLQIRAFAVGIAFKTTLLPCIPCKSLSVARGTLCRRQWSGCGSDHTASIMLRGQKPWAPLIAELLPSQCRLGWMSVDMLLP